MPDYEIDRKYPDHTSLTEIEYTKKDRFLTQLEKIVPISVKDLKSKHPKIAAGLDDLISFNKGAPLTKEVIAKYRDSLDPEKFKLDYSLWRGEHRSITTANSPLKNRPQFTMHILVSPKIKSKLKSNPALDQLFKFVNQSSGASGHPMVLDQMGWARLELDPDKEYILVDEIQSDHSGAVNLIRIGQRGGEYIGPHFMRQYHLTEEQFQSMVDEYENLMKEFPNIATEAIGKFARSNGYKKIYWHTHESGIKYKDPAEGVPPKSLYDKLPKSHFFKETDEKPFSLDANFFVREAKGIHQLVKTARMLYLKYIR